MVTARIEVMTIGFTQSSAESFFERLRKAGARKIIDVRLHNTSQLAGFAKASDLKYLLRSIGSIDYIHAPILAPTDEMLRTYKKEKGDWSVYERQFIELMEERRIESKLSPDDLQQACLLCSEAKPHHCHRRLVCEYLNRKWHGVLTVRNL